MKRLFIFLLLPVSIGLVVTSCRPWQTAHPFNYAPRCYDCMWDDCVSPPIPDCFLVQTPPCPENVCAPKEVDLLPSEPLNLYQLFDIGLKNSPATKITWAEARIAAARWGISQQNDYPQLSFNAFWGAFRQSGFFVGNNQLFVNKYREYGPYLNLSYLLLDFGTTVYQSEAFFQQLISTNRRHNREIQTVIQTLSLDYYSYITEKEKVLASLANLEDANTTLKATEAKHLAGIADITDELIAKTQVARVTLALLGNEQAVADTKAQLLTDAGIPSNREVDIASISDFTSDDSLMDSIDNYLCLAYSSRPDLQAAYAEVLAANNLVIAAKRDQLPKITFDSTWGKNYFNDGLSKGTDYSAQISLSFPLFAGFYYENQIKEAQAEKELAEADLNATELVMVQQVVTSYQDLSFAREQVQVAKEYVLLAEATFKATLAQYKAGTVDITTLVNSLTNVADARYSLANTKKLWFDALSSLSYATGSLSLPCNKY